MNFRPFEPHPGHGEITSGNAYRGNVYQDHLGDFWVFARGSRAKHSTLMECIVWARTEGARTLEYNGEIIALTEAKS